jgi:hypothetical protein
VCSLDNFNRLFSGSVSNTLERQGIADASGVPRGRGKGNTKSNLNKKPQHIPVNIPLLFHP